MRLGLTVAHICIVSRNAPAANPRVVKEAQALLWAGHDVTVVHGKYGGWSRMLDDGALPAGCRRIGVWFGPAAPARRRIAQLLVRTMARVLAKLMGPSEAIAFRGYGDAAYGLCAAAKTVPADLFIAHLTEGLTAAARAAKARNTPFAFDAEDFHPGDRPDTAEHALDNAMLVAIERKHLPSCAYVTAAAPGIADAYAERYGVPRPIVVRNTFSRTMAPVAADKAGTAPLGPSVYWFSQTIGETRGLECAIRAIAASRSRPHLYLRGEPAPGYIEKLQGLASREGVGDRLHILPPAPPNEMVALAASYDAGLVGEIGHTHNRRIALTNKQFTYILAGLPAIMSDVPAHKSFADTAEGAAFLYRADDPASLAATMDALFLDSGVLPAARERAFALGQTEFCWERDRQVLLKTVQTALAASRNEEAG